MLWFLMLMVGVDAFTRSYIDYGTPIGNCTENHPIYWKRIDLDTDPECLNAAGLMQLTFPFQKIS